MKKIISLLAFLLLLGFVYFSFQLTPSGKEGKTVPDTEFSLDRALKIVKELSVQPHYVGSDAHQVAADYVKSQLEALGLEPQIQEGFSLNSQSKTLDKPRNIMARIQGSEKGKALLLLAHYDSAPVPSYGAGDDASGVAAVLESVRAYLATNPKPKNDIIILFTDAEELGLDGARLFVNEHPWAKEVGLAINFEARGTAGPSNMILETNQGNRNLVKGFMKANPEYPVATSLMYTIYKMLPNDTDSTVFREDGDIDGFFFAFIDDHFNYHTAGDNYDNLSRKSLEHQGSYLLPLLRYFAQADLSKIKSDKEDVYFNFPLVRMVHYPFSWTLPMWGLALALFIFLVVRGFKEERLTSKGIWMGSLYLGGPLLFTGLAGYYGWKWLLKLNPQYGEILHGFTYNGHDYIAAFAFLALTFCFLAVWRTHKIADKASLYVITLAIWLLVTLGLTLKLTGAAYFVIPVYFGLLSFYLMMEREMPNRFLTTILGAPAIFIFVPLIEFFPVGLGLKMLFAAALFTVLIFMLLSPVFLYFNKARGLALICLLISGAYFTKASFSSGFSKDRKKPNSLIFYQNEDEQKAYFVTYDHVLDEWTEKYLGKEPQSAAAEFEQTSYSKYGTGYSFMKEVPMKEIPLFEVKLNQKSSADSLIQEVDFVLIPKRRVNRIELYDASGETPFRALQFNGKNVDIDQLSATYRGTRNSALINYYVSPGDSLQVKMKYPKGQSVKLKVVEYSYDLMKNPLVRVDKRADDMMPKPFVVTDAVAVQRTIALDSLTLNK